MNPQNESTEIVNDFNFPYDLSKPDKVYELPTILKEISALSIAPNGELACEQDEEGIIFFYNLDQKKITNRFIFGKAGDYEGIEFVGEIVYVLRSDGTIFEIKNLGKTNQIVTTYNTKLNRKNDTEGLGYDAEMNCLLIACKGKAANIQMIYKPKAVYAFDLKTKSLRAEPVMLFSKEILYNYIETNDLKATIIFLKKQLSKTNEKSEIKTFEKFIELLQRLKEKDLSSEQMEGIESYIQYLELEKIPSFSNEMFKQKLTKFKKHLKNKLRFVPNNYYTTWAASFGISFAVGFSVQRNIDYSIKIGVISAALLIIGIGVIMDMRMKRQERSFNF
jgi:hypothetical protein